MTKFASKGFPKQFLQGNLLTLLLSLFFLVACNPGISVVISNNTASAREIKVIYPENFELPHDWYYDYYPAPRGSVRTYKLNIPFKYNKIATVVSCTHFDTAARTYTFTLPANYKAVVESRLNYSSPTYEQVFIIDNADTVILKKRSKKFKSKPPLFLRSSWVYTIK
jgi:hypothetical protein